MTPTRTQVRWVQASLNRYFARRRLGLRPLAVDGRAGGKTAQHIDLFYFYTGIVHWKSPHGWAFLIGALKNPAGRLPGYKGAGAHAQRLARGKTRQVRRQRALSRSVSRAGVVRSTAAGNPHWGGSRYVGEEVLPIARRFGAPITSTKRNMLNGNRASDHNWWASTAYAIDMGTFRGLPLATAIRRHYGNQAYAGGTYVGYYVRRGGRVYRLQTLWAVAGHFNHVHHGIRR